MNGRQVLFEYGHGKYWYLGDRVLPQVEHVYPLTTIPAPPCHIVQLVDFLANEEIARAHDGYFVAGVEGNYFEFVWDHLQGCLVGRMVFLFPSKLKPFFFFLQIAFPYFCLVTIFACWNFSLLLLKGRKGERKRKRFPLLTMLVVLLVLS